MVQEGVPGTPRATELTDASAVRRFLDLSIDLLTILDLETTILAASDSWEVTLGRTPASVIGRTLLEFFHPDDLPRIEHELAELLEGRDAVGVVVRVFAGDGTYRWVQGNARPDLAAGRIYVTAADITARMALERSLRDQLRLEDLVAAIASRLIGADVDRIEQEIEDGLRDLARLLGADRAHLLRGSRDTGTTRLIEWLDPETGQRVQVNPPHPEVAKWWEDRMRAGRLVRLEDVSDLDDTAPLVADALRADGVQSVVLVPLPIRHAHWGFFALVATQAPIRFSDDATALLRLAGECFMSALAHRDDALALLDARAELQHRNEDLERANEELERFAYVAAHDLRAPLARVEMALSAVRSGAEESSHEVLLEIAQRSANRMGQLIQDLLTFAGVGAARAEMTSVDLDALVSSVLSDLAPTLEASEVWVETRGLPRVTGHEGLLRQLLQNLIDNAVKFRRTDVDPIVRVEASTRRGEIELAVRDNGIGIDPAHRSEVFGVFTRLHPGDVAEGSGIGLATCAKVVAQHRGRIWVEDGLDGGTAVIVRLPLDQPISSS